MKLPKDRIVKIDEPLKDMRPIIKKWVDLIVEYSSSHKKEDALYWYNERATLSTLAGAIWLSKGNALEEFSSTKKKSENRKSKRTKTGRTDLRFAYKKKEYIVEAKQIFPSMNPRKLSIPALLEKTLRKACGDVKKFVPPKPVKKYVRIGIVFLAPYLPESYGNNNQEIKSKIQELNKKLQEKHKHHLFVSIFSDCTQKLKDEKGLIYPLIVLAARVTPI